MTVLRLLIPDVSVSARWWQRLLLHAECLAIHALLLTLLTLLAYAQSVATINIVVRDTQGGAVAGAVVRLRASNQPNTEAVTNAEGQCQIHVGAPDRYEASAERPGFEPARRDVTVRAGTASAVTLTLQPAAILQQVTVVSGSRAEELQDESAQRVEAVTRREILATGYQRVSDVLSEMVGVTTRRGSTAAVAGEQIQGIDSRQVAVLQDGLPIPGARGIKSGVLNLNRQSTQHIERVEVAKGAGSALYGTDAIGGVINLITREPASPFQSDLSLSGGSKGMLDGQGSVSGRRGRVSVLVSGGWHQMDAYRLIPSTETTVGPDWRRYDGSGKLRWTVHPRLTLGLTATGYHNRETGVNLTEQGTARGLLNDSVQSYALTADYVPAPNLTVQGRAYRARYDENSKTTLFASTAGSPALANLNQVYERLDATLGYNRSGHLLQTGAEWIQDLYRGVNRLVGDNAGRQITMTDGWLQDRWKISPRVTLTVGGRVTGHSVYGAKAVPKAGLVVRASESLILRASYGHGLRAPDLGQLYYRFANPASFYQVIGNPNLRPETSQSIQAGAGWRGRKWRTNLTLFHNRVRDLIDFTQVGRPRTAAEAAALLDRYAIPPSFDPILNRPVYLYQNLARALTRGAEVDAEVSLVKQWRVRGAYTFLDARDETTRLRLAQRHRHQGFIGTEYAIPRWGLTTNLRGTLFSPWLLNAATGTRAYGYSLWDLYAAKRLPKGTTLFAAIDNLLNSTDRKLREATPSFDRPEFGRGFRVGLRWSVPRE